MLEPEVLEELEKTLDDIKEKSIEGAAIIVEGKNDRRALRKLGITGPVHEVPSGGRNPLDSLEDLRDYDVVIILTDFDQPGEELADFCKKNLQKFAITIRSDLRNKLRNFVRKAVKDVEGIATFMESERASKNNGKNGLYEIFRKNDY